jgi:glyoxylase-like metal-dependent hydrolase (beta-lactamase superfamily II)
MMQRLDLDGVTVESVLERTGPRFKPLDLMPTASLERFAVHRPWLEPDLFEPNQGLLSLDRQSFIIRTPRHTIMVDTCVGADKERSNPQWHHLQSPWLANFTALGLKPEDIDIVFCTHLHGDHVGWNTRLKDGKWVPTFPNARYLFGRIEYEHAKRELERRPDPDGPLMEDSVFPVVEAGQAVFVEEGFEIEPGFRLELTAGHTPGHMCLDICAGRRAVFCGDLMHHPVQVREPQWSSCFCLDPKQSAATRHGFLERHCDTGTLIVPAHFGRGTVGRVQQSRDWGFDFGFLQAR